MVEYKEHKDGRFWRMHGGFYIRDHPQWTKKHPLGPVSFDMMCFECDFMIEDTFDCELPEKLKNHWVENHALPRFFAEIGVVFGNGEGI